MNLRFLAFVVGLAAGLVSHPASAQVVAPSQGGGVNIVHITATSMELSFGTTGSGQGRIVAIAATTRGISVPLAANDNYFYSADTTYGKGSTLGKGYVVFNGTSHSVTIMGLEPSTYYYIANAEYNTDGTSIMYNTSGTSILTSTRTGPPVPAPLPVELVSFTGKLDKLNISVLQWATATERNTAYFGLERSFNGVTFSEIGQVAAAGSSTQRLSYEWSDPQHVTKLTYYRLRQVDRDGTVAYSSMVSLAPIYPIIQLIEVYPNPSTGEVVQLLLSGFSGETISMRLADALGRPILSQMLLPAEAQYLVPLHLPRGLAAGTYFLTFTGNGSSIQKRIVVSN